MLRPAQRRPPTRRVRASSSIEPPTLINLGFEWFIDGDDNRNATVAVSYRKAGETRWLTALPLLRLHGERINNGAQLDVISPNMFAGSILDLEPDTAYEARFVVADPDGVTGEAQKTVSVRTRPEPKPAAGGRTFHVYPPGFKGQKLEPSFEGLMCAYNITCSGTDWATAGRPRVKPGDIILVHAGLYKYNRLEYTNDPAVNRTVPLDGTYYLTADGTADRPIVIKGAGDGEAIFDGAGNFALFDVKAADYTYFEGLTFRNTDYRDLGGHAVHCRRERTDGEALPVRGRGLRRLHELLGFQQLLHCRQLFHRPRRSESRDWLVGQLLGAVQRRRRAEVSAGDGVVCGRQGLRARPCHRLQLRGEFSRRHRHRDLWQPGRIRRRR